MRTFLAALLLFPLALHAQDERRVVSPNGQLEFRLFVAQPDDGLYGRIGYQIFFRGKPLIATSWMGMDIRDQEPLLGEKPGLMSSDASSGGKDHYNSMIAHYMQNGSLGRLLDLEVRAYDDGVAFRYDIPKSTPLEDILVKEEMTEFNFAHPGVLDHLAAKPDYDLPFVIDEPGVGPVIITAAGPESRSPKYPRTYLARTADGMRTTLSRSKSDPIVAFTGKTPLVWPWRAVIVGVDREHLAQSATLRDLNH